MQKTLNYAKINNEQKAKAKAKVQATLKYHVSGIKLELTKEV